MPDENDSTAPKKTARPNRLRQLRLRSKAAGGLWLTDYEVGAVLGIDRSLVVRHELGQRSLTDEQIKQYASLYKVQSHQIFTGVPRALQASARGARTPRKAERKERSIA